MRILIAALLALNILYFVGVYLFGVVFNQPPPLKEPDTPTITLLSMSSAVNPNEQTQRSNSCFSIGPYSVEKTARLVAAKISDEGFTVNIRNQQTDRINNYLVFLPQLATREQAEKVVADIKQHQIQNYSIIESGPYENAIALGTFSNLDKARRHAEYVRYLGYDARYTEQRQRAQVYWIAYSEPIGRSAPVEELSRTVDPKAVVQKIPEACE